jgi:hypothetical protein
MNANNEKERGMVKRLLKRMLRKKGRFGLGVALCTTVTWVGGAPNCEWVGKDWAREDFELTLPTPEPLNLNRVPRALVEEHYVGNVRLVSLLARSDFQTLQAEWDAVDRIADESKRFEKTMGMLKAVEGRGLYLHYQAQAWRRHHPQSAAAQLTELAALLGAAGKARGFKFASETGAEQWHLSRLRWNEARALAEPIAIKSDHHRSVVDSLATWMRFAHGESAEAWAGIERLMSRYPQLWWLYGDAQNFAFRQWSGEKSAARLDLVREKMTTAGVSAAFRGEWEANLQANNNPPRNFTAPGAEQQYWVQRAKASASVSNLVSWLEVEKKLTRWPKVVELSDRVLAIDRHHAYAWQMRGYALSVLGDQDGARESMMHAAVLGNNWALGQLVYAHFRGGYGVKPGDHAALLDLCRLGAAMGNAAGVNCIGAAFTDGFGNHRRDQREALRWHLWAARADERNSSHDVAILLPRLVQGRSEEVGVAAEFWLRDAARQEHTLAINKLKAMPDTTKGCFDTAAMGQASDPTAWWWSVLQWLAQILLR